MTSLYLHFHLHLLFWRFIYLSSHGHQIYTYIFNNTFIYLFIYNAVSTNLTKLGVHPMVTYIVVKKSKDNGKITPIFCRKYCHSEFPLSK